MKIFISSFTHESSSFSPIPTSRRSFTEAIYMRPGLDADLRVVLQRTRGSAYGEWLGAALADGHEVVCGLMADATPSAPCRRDDYERLRAELLEDLEASLPVDVVLLMLHGAQMAESYDDCEGDIIARVREHVGPHVPIGVELDLHCNVTPAMLSAATVINACKEYPHTDFADRARDLYRIVTSIAAGCIAPTMAFVRVPMLNVFFTTREPMRGFVDRLAALEGHDGVLSISLAHGFPLADTPFTSAGVIVVTDADRGRAEQLAVSIGRQFFDMREIAGPPSQPIAVTLAAALASDDPRPTVIADGSDNPGVGAASDSTFVLAALLDRGISGAALGMLWDPVAVDFCHDAGVGARLQLRIGGKVGPNSGAPLDVFAEVTALAEDPCQYGFADRQDNRMGRAAAIRIDGVDVVLNARRSQVMSPEAFSELGIDPRKRRLLVVKSNQHFYARFAPMSARILYCEAPGTASNNPWVRNYRRLARPIWPLDEVAI